MTKYALEINQLRNECKTVIAAPFKPIADSKCKTCVENKDKKAEELCESCVKSFAKIIKPNLDFSSITAELDEVLSVAANSDFDVCYTWNERFNQPVEKLFDPFESCRHIPVDTDCHVVSFPNCHECQFP